MSADVETLHADLWRPEHQPEPAVPGAGSGGGGPAEGGQSAHGPGHPWHVLREAPGQGAAAHHIPTGREPARVQPGDRWGGMDSSVETSRV